MDLRESTSKESWYNNTQLHNRSYERFKFQSLYFLKFWLTFCKIGNPMLSILTDFQGVFDFFWTHAMISDEAHKSITKCLKLSPLGSDPHNQPPECADSGKSLADVCNVIDVHNIYARRCYSPGIKPVLGRERVGWHCLNSLSYLLDPIFFSRFKCVNSHYLLLS